MRLAVALGLALGTVAAGVAEACPDPSLAPSSGEVALSEGFADDPHVVSAAAGGSASLDECGFGVAGWVADAPDFALSYQTGGGYPLTIAVDASADTVLLVRAPDGRFHYDDDGGSELGFDRGGVVFFPQPAGGTYQIWVGTFAQGSGQPAQLVFTELLE